MWQTALRDGRQERGRKAPAPGIWYQISPDQATHFCVFSTEYQMSKKTTGGGKPHKESSSKMSTLASRILSGDKKPTVSDARKLAGSVLSQDEHRGQRRRP